jgi:hypothetical protein
MRKDKTKGGVEDRKNEKRFRRKTLRGRKGFRM